MRSHTLYEDARCLTAHYDVLGNDDVVFWFGVYHDGSGIEVSEGALVDGRVTPQR